MAEPLRKIEEQISLISLSEQISLMAYLANTIKQKANSADVQKKKRYFGMAKGEFEIPDDIDFCNDEIAEMFGVNE